MKFGHNLPRNQVPEWAAYYIDYKALKKHIKGLAQKVAASEQVDLTGQSRRRGFSNHPC